MKQWIFLLLAGMVSLGASAGCGNSNGLYHVSGKVLYKGEPAAGATVSFLPKSGATPENGQSPFGIVQDDGTFTLVGPQGQGAAPGEYVVLVEWKEGAGKVKGRSPGLNAPDRLGRRYLNPKQPLLTAVVEPKSNYLPTFEIK